MATVAEIIGWLRLKGGETFNSDLKSRLGKARKEFMNLNNAIAGTGIVLLLHKMNSAANDATNAFMGLNSVAKFKGIAGADQAVQQLEAVKSGMLNAEDAAFALKNLLSRGYDLPAALNTLNQLSNAAAFNRASHLSLGEAVKTATEGLKNENSILVDNSGVTKNVSVMWKEYADSIGVVVNQLSLAQKIQAEQNGIMQETQAQMGDFAKLSRSAAGDQARLAASNKKLAASFGLIYQQVSGPFVVILTGIADFLIKAPAWVRNLTAAIGIMSITLKIFNGTIKALWTSIGPAGWLLIAVSTLAGAFGILTAATRDSQLELMALDTAQAENRLRKLQRELMQVNNALMRPRATGLRDMDAKIDADIEKRADGLKREITLVQKHIAKLKAMDDKYNADKWLKEYEALMRRYELLNQQAEREKSGNKDSLDGLIEHAEKAGSIFGDLFEKEREMVRDIIFYVQDIAYAVGQAITNSFKGQGNPIKEFLKAMLVSVIDFLERYLFLAKIKTLIDTIINPWSALKNAAPLLAAVGLMEAAKGAVMAMANGTVVTRPTLALVGEAGTEVVAPKRDFMDYSRELMREAGMGRGRGMEIHNHFNTPLNDRRQARFLSENVLKPELRRGEKRARRYSNGR